MAALETSNVADAAHALNEVTQAAQQLRQTIGQTAYPFISLRIPASLERFERAYVHFLKSQNLRWLLLDVLLPLAVAGMALWYLMR